MQSISANTDDNINDSFTAVFYDGHSFKNLVDFLKRSNIMATLEFHRTAIKCFHHDPEGENIINCVHIESKDLYKYEVNTDKDSIEIGVNLRDLQRFIKSIGKKDSLTIYKNKKDPGVYIIIANSSSKSPQDNFSVFLPCVPNKITLDIPEYHIPESMPSLVIPAVNLSSTFNALNVLKSSRIRIRTKENKLIMDNLTDDRSSGRVDSFPMRYYEGVVHPEYDILVKAATLKSLTKLSSLNPNGLLKLYLEKEKPLYISSRINTCGELRIYLKSLDK